MKDTKGHGSNPRGITKVTAIRYSNEPGSSRRTVSVTHNLGTTSGYEDNLHMGALVTRGLREGATVSGGEAASGHQIDAAAASLHSDTAKSAPAPVHDSMTNLSAGIDRGHAMRSAGDGGHVPDFGGNFYSRASAKGGRELGSYGPHPTREKAATTAWANHPTARQVSTSRGPHGFDIQWHDKK